MKKLALSALSVLIAASAMVTTVDTANAQEWQHRRPERYAPPPPPPRHRHGNRDAIVGGLAAGVVGGLIGGAIANNNGPRYVEPPPLPPRCWFEDRRVANAYDGGWHMESVRVCR